jgi:hypothetical protein
MGRGGMAVVVVVWGVLFLVGVFVSDLLEVRRKSVEGDGGMFISTLRNLRRCELGMAWKSEGGGDNR